MGTPLAKSIEKLVGKPNGWMDQDHQRTGANNATGEAETNVLSPSLAAQNLANEIIRKSDEGVLSDRQALAARELFFGQEETTPPAHASLRHDAPPSRDQFIRDGYNPDEHHR